MPSLRRQLTLGLIAAFAVLVAAGGAAIYYVVRSALYRQFDHGLQARALAVATAAEQDGDEIEVDFSDKYLREFDNDVGTAFFQVWTYEGVPVERSESLGAGNLPIVHGTMEKPHFWNLDLPQGGHGRATGFSFVPRGDGAKRTTPSAIVVVAADRSELDGTLHGFAWILAGGGGGLLLATALVVPLVVGPRLRPLQRVADQAGTIGAGTLAQRFPVEGLPAELLPICERLNALLARLEESFARERRFSSDLAHELLTPLAELRVLTESAIKWPDASGAETHQRALEVQLRMEEMTTRLLDLARAENGRLPVSLAPLALPALLQEAWRPFAAAAAAKGQDVSFAGPETAGVTTDASLLRAILRNLFSNAVDHSPAGGFIRVEWRVEGAAFQLRVSNPAPQLEPPDTALMFERLWRKDAARSGTHSGLGLALARQIAAALGGTLEADLDGGVLTMTFANRETNAA